MASKREMLPMGDTPGKPIAKSQRPHGDSRRSLFPEPNAALSAQSKVPKSVQWSDIEMRALVEYIALFWSKSADAESPWPTSKNSSFWIKCANYISEECGLELRSWAAVRTRVQKFLKQKFVSISEAEGYYGIDYELDTRDEIRQRMSGEMVTPKRDDSTQTFPFSPVLLRNSPIPLNLNESCNAQVITDTMNGFKNLSMELKKELLISLFKEYADSLHPGKNLSSLFQGDFLQMCVNASKNLKDKDKDNLLVHFVKCFQLKEDGPNTRLPIGQMPFGLLDYVLKFFASDSTNRLKCEPDYLSWQQSMYAKFGVQWVCMHRGPCWEFAVGSDELDTDVPVIATDLPSNNPVSACEKQNTETKENFGCDVVDVLAAAIEMTRFDENLDVLHDDKNSCKTDLTKTTSQSSSLWSAASEKTLTEGQFWGGNEQNSIAQKFGLGSSSSSGKQAKVPKNPFVFKSMKAKVNVPGLSLRAIQGKIQKAGFSRNSETQMELVKEIANNGGTTGRWWIKADGCDVKKGLCESVKHTWSGDVDLGDGSLQKLYQEYVANRNFVQGIGIGSRKVTLLDDLSKMLVDLEKEKPFLASGEQTSKEKYHSRIQVANVNQEQLFSLGWEVEGFRQLLGMLENLKSKTSSMISKFFLPVTNRGNFSGELSNLKTEILNYLQQLFLKKRTVATHILVFMIAEEKRNHKPYAIPIRALPFASMPDAKLRELMNEVKGELTAAGLTVVGSVTDGEWSSLRTQGTERPVSVIQLLMDARKEATSTRAGVIITYLKFDMQTSMPIKSHPAIPSDDVQWLHQFMKDHNLPFESAIFHLRQKFFPQSYNPCTWQYGRNDSVNSCLKAIFAQYLFVHKINQLFQEGVDFINNAYFPETIAETNEPFHEREDHGHLLKRLTTSFREGNVPGIDLRRFAEALKDNSTGLTKQALTGERKQNVADCEKFFSKAVLEFMQRKGYQKEAKIISIVRNWHRAVDGRGLDDITRSTYVQAMLEWLLADWLPSYAEGYIDFRTLDVSRKLSSKKVQGLTRETVIGLLANLSSLQMRRKEYAAREILPEHPRAGTSDDVEGFIGSLHDMLGPIFTVQDFYHSLPKILNEYKKRIDNENPFYYWTGNKHRYKDFPLASFNEPSSSGIERLDKTTFSRRADPGLFQAERASMPVHGSITKRAEFHRFPETLPKPPPV